MIGISRAQQSLRCQYNTRIAFDIHCYKLPEYLLLAFRCTLCDSHLLPKPFNLSFAAHLRWKAGNGSRRLSSDSCSCSSLDQPTPASSRDHAVSSSKMCCVRLTLLEDYSWRVRTCMSASTCPESDDRSVTQLRKYRPAPATQPRASFRATWLLDCSESSSWLVISTGIDVQWLPSCTKRPSNDLVSQS
jgi:hypothetical protein